MNILFVTKELPYPVNNGHRVRSSHILKGLAKEHKIHLVCFGDQHTHKDQILAMQRFCASVTLVPENPNLAQWKKYFVAVVSLFSTLPYAVKLRSSKLMKDKVQNLLSTKNIELVIYDGIHMAWDLPSTPVRKVLSEHNVESTIIQRYYHVEPNIWKKVYAYIEWRKMRGFEQKTWKKFDWIFVCSHVDKKEVETRIGHSKVAIVANGVDIQYYSPKDIDIKEKSLIYTGLMSWRPNEDAVVYFLKEVYPLIKMEVRQVTFWVVGNNPTEAVKKFAEHDGSVAVTGYVDDVRQYVLQSEIFVVPLRIGSGTRLKILEAMAMGKPIVSTTIGCEGLEVTPGENITIADTPAEFARRIVELLKNPQLTRNIGLAARRLVQEKYTWERITENLNQLVREISK